LELISDVVRTLRIPTFILVRARAGTFVYTDAEIDVMRQSIQSAAELGAAGIVIGALTPDSRIDVARTRILVEASGKLPVTFHRAFDVVADQLDAIEQLIDLGVSRVLTSGGAATAEEGADAIVGLRDKARERIGILAAGKIREHNVREVIDRTGVSEVHGRLTDEPSMRRLVEIAHRPGMR
jgi:copper homeostasis protein